MPRNGMGVGKIPRNGSGVYSLPPVYLAVPGTTVRAEQHNSPLQDLASAMTASLPRDGTAPMLGDLPMNGRRITNLGAGVNASDAARIDQVPVSAYLTSVSALALAANEMVYASGVNVAAKTALTAFARTLLDDADAATARTTLGLAAGALAAALDQAAWNAGASTTEAIISPAKLQAKIAAQVAAINHEDGPDPTTTGTAFAFQGVPDGVNRIDVMFDGISLSGTDSFLIQLGTGVSPTTTGYDSGGTLVGSSSVTATNGFVIDTSNPAQAFIGAMALDRVPGSNKWVSTSTLRIAGGADVSISTGVVTLSGPLNNIRLTRTGTDTFDAGSWSIRARA